MTKKLLMESKFMTNSVITIVLLYVAINNGFMIRRNGSVSTNDANNPYLYPCTTDSDCGNKYHSCATDGGPNSSYWFCASGCGGSSCTQNEDCATNICNNRVCATTGGMQGSQCGGTCQSEESCAAGYYCQPWGSSEGYQYGYCGTKAPSNNPYMYPCTMDSDCSNKYHSCATDGGPNSSYWFCASGCGGSSCTQNEDCATNICNNRVCATTGGMQGSQCGGACQSEESCAAGYYCQPWGSSEGYQYGYCGTKAPSNNPYLYPCTMDSDCSNKYHSCVTDGGPNSSYWFCDASCGGGSCTQNEDCVTNICNNRVCATTGGPKGSFCGGTCENEEGCAEGLFCQPWGESEGYQYGYCGTKAPVNNPYLYPCTMDSDCSNKYHSCVTDGGPNSSYWFCTASCGGGSCTQNEDCVTNICNNRVCATTGGPKGSFCGGSCQNEEGCAEGLFCQPWGEAGGYQYGYCGTRRPINNPYLYPCTMDSDCSNKYHSCVTTDGASNSSYWFCDAGCGGSSCTENEDCVTNICTNRVCSSTGGTQGAFCGESCKNEAQCSPGYICQPWGMSEGYQNGYCDSTAPTSPTTTTTTVKTSPLIQTTTTANISNPYLYPCTSDGDCNNTLKACAENDGPASSHGFCTCYCGGGPCAVNGDCCTNICTNRICATSGGTQGAVCSYDCGTQASDQCASGYSCESWGDFGYCNYNPSAA